MDAPNTEASDDSEPEQDLEELVRHAQTGDRLAFENIDRALRPHVAQRVRIKLGRKLRQYVDSEDIVQETFVEAFKLLPAFSWTRNGCLLRWIEVIAEHQVLRAVRRHKRRSREVSMPRSSQFALPLFGGIGPFVAQGATPSGVAVHNEAIDRVLRALARLKPDRRNVVVLAHVFGLKT